MKSLPSHSLPKRVLILLSALLAFAQVQATQPAQAHGVDPDLRSALEQALSSPDSFQDRFHAEVWLLDMSTRLDKLAQRSKSLSRRLKDPEERMSMLRTIHREAKRARLNPKLVMALIEVESAFDRFAISHSGAQGLMQVMPFWLRELEIPEGNLFHLDTNLRMGCTILRFYLDKEAGNLHRALARYNGSLGKHSYPNKVMKARRVHWY